MRDGELKLGDGLLLRAFKDHPAPTLQLNYGAPKKKDSYHLALWLGIWSEGSATVDERLNHLGWVFDPERAAQGMEARQGGDEGSVHDSPMSAGHAPDDQPLYPASAIEAAQIAARNDALEAVKRIESDIAWTKKHCPNAPYVGIPIEVAEQVVTALRTPSQHQEGPSKPHDPLHC